MAKINAGKEDIEEEGNTQEREYLKSMYGFAPVHRGSL